MSAVSSHPAPTSRWRKSAWYVFCLVALGGTVFWAQHVVADLATEEQRALVPVSTVWGMHACLFLGLVAFAGVAVALGRELGRRHLWAALGLAVLGFVACGLAPKTIRIFYDEHIYMQIGQTIAHTGRAEYATYVKAEYGDFQVIKSWVNKQPNGHPYLLSWVYRLGGASEDISFTTERVVVGLTTALLYLALTVLPLTLPAGAPLAAALCYLFTPVVLWWGHTVSSEATAVFTVVAAIAAASLHARWRDPATGEGSLATATLLAATAAFAAYFRPESLLVYPVVASLLWAVDRRFLEDRVTWAAFALSLALIAPELLHLWSVRTEDWGATDGHRFGAAKFLHANFVSNTGYFIQQKWFPLAGTVLAVCGAVWLALRQCWLGVCAAVWFLLSWGIFVLFYAGGYHYGASSRYAVISASAVGLLMGVGVGALGSWLRRRPVALAVAGFALLLNWVCAMHIVPTLARESNEARADIEFARLAAAKLPWGSLIVSTDPCVWAMLGRNSSELQHVENLIHTNLRELANQYPGGVYLHWDYWMNCQPEFAEIWRQLLLETHATLVLHTQAEAAKLAIFRLDTPYAVNVFSKSPVPDEKPRGVDLDAVIAETARLSPYAPASVPASAASLTPAPVAPSPSAP